MDKLTVKEYLGNKIEFKIVEGKVYANATTMCKVFGKQPSDWLKIKSTQEYIEELKRSENLPNELVSSIQGGKANEQGTWIHEKLILDLARWLNVKFRVWCDEQIATLLRDGKVELQPMSIQQMMILTLQEQEKLVNRVDNGEQRKIQKAVGTRVYQRMDIAENHQNKNFMFQAIYRDLKDRFGVASYRDIKRKDLTVVLEYIAGWIEPVDLRRV